MTGRPRRALYVCLSATPGGAERSLLLLARELPAHGWTPVVACPPGELAGRMRAAGVEVAETTWRPMAPMSSRDGGRKSYPAGRMARALGATLANATTAARLARRVRADVIVSNSFYAHPFTGLAGVAARRPSVWHMRDIVEEGFGRRLLGAASRLPAEVIAISRAVADTVPSRDAHVIANPIDPPAPEAPAGRDDDRTVVGFLGRLDPRKGLEDLIDAAALVEDARFEVVGAPRFAPEGYVDDLRRRAEPVADRLTFAGPVPDPGEALRRFDLLAVPSEREPWGRVAAEALAAGVPVVAADSGGLPEIVRDGIDGFLYPPGDVPALAGRISALSADGPLRARMGRAGREGAARFLPSDHAGRVALILDRAVA
ncbi:MAG: glycosyltransferase family 4 protein [Thermoleophilia bacterium]